VSKLLVAKAISYRVLSLFITFLVVYVLTHSFPTATLSTILIESLKTAWYYCYDRLWCKLGYFSIREKGVQGIKGTYPLIPVSEKLKGYIALCRPLTVLVGLLAGVLLYALACAYYGVAFDWHIAVAAGLVLGVLHSAAQVANQVVREEIEIDKINKPYRPIVRGLVSVRSAKIFAALLFAASLVTAFVISSCFAAYAAIIAFFSIFYTAPPLRVKRIFLLNNAWQGVARGLLPPLAVFSIFSGFKPDTLPLALGSVIALWLTGGQAAKDANDVEGDRRFGIKNFFTVLGDAAPLAMLAFMLAAFALLNAYILVDVLPLRFAAMNILILPSISVVKNLNCTLAFVENNLGWVYMYGTLGLWYLMPAVLCMF